MLSTSPIICPKSTLCIAMHNVLFGQYDSLVNENPEFGNDKKYICHVMSDGTKT